ncbi:MAG: response regulator transcription factor [Treponema sp.]|jgi:DNA-binding NarL/FixJ family response regulator|nr:response regulator transcription factor [Treponema sp.]
MVYITVVSGNAGERARLCSILQQWPEFDVSGLDRDAYNALNFVHSSKPDIALVEEDPLVFDCPGMVLALKRWSPDTKVIVLANSRGSRAVLDSVVNGAAGYLLKGSDTELVPAIRWVHLGGTLMEPETASQVFGDSPGERVYLNQGPDVKITRKEMDLLARLGKGLSSKEIAAELRLKDGTIRNYISGLLRKTGLRNRTEIALYVQRAGITNNEWKVIKKALV